MTQIKVTLVAFASVCIIFYIVSMLGGSTLVSDDVADQLPWYALGSAIFLVIFFTRKSLVALFYKMIGKEMPDKQEIVKKQLNEEER